MIALIIFNLITLLIFYLLLNNAYQLANYLKLFDQPNKRKIHKKKIPLIGGVLIWLTFGLSLLIQYYSFNLNIEFLKFYILSSLFFLIGFIDDKYSLKANLRLFLLFFLSVIIYKFLGINEVKFILVDKIGLIHIYYGSIFFSVFCLLLFQNSMNMIDGLNGLSTSIFIGLLLFLLLKNLSLDQFIIIQLTLFLIIFLFFNLKNKIFMGDAGIYFLSCFIGLCVIHLSQNQSNITVNSIFLIMILPGIDMLRLFIQRIYNKTYPFNPDKNHIHHILIKKYSSNITLAIILCLSFFPIIAFEFLKINYFITLILFFIIYFWLISKKKSI